MIFVTVGSQKFQFNRLLKAIDRLVEEGIINEKVFAQTGYSDYQPKHYDTKAFLDRDEIAQVVEDADIIITHGGTGSIISAVKKEKMVIAVPRKAEFGEHVDDHQYQIIEQFTEMNLILSCDDMNELTEVLKDVRVQQFNKYRSNTEKIIENIEKFILA